MSNFTRFGSDAITVNEQIIPSCDFRKKKKSTGKSQLLEAAK